LAHPPASSKSYPLSASASAGSKPGTLPLPKGKPPARSRRRRLWVFAAAVAALTIAAWAGQRLFFPGAAASAEITALVTRADLPVIVTERGQLESARTVTSKCEVEGEPSKIVFLTPEGTRVKKGEVVVRFDTDKIRRGVAEQEIKFKTADGKAKAAKEELDVQKNKSETEIAKAELALELAELDRKKYLEGEYKVEVDDKNGAINLATRELKEAQDKLEGFRTFVKKGFGTPEELRIKELDVFQKQYVLDRDKAKLMVLQKYTLRRQEVELKAKEKDAERELARTKSTSRANIAKAETDHETSLAVAKLEREQLERIAQQLKHVEIKAPQDGIVVFDQSRPWDPTSRIQLGGMVTYQQPVFLLPDLDFMQVKVKIHESKVKKVRAGQKATIRVEAFAGLVLKATVEKVATLADSDRWWRGGIKEFETVLKIDELPTGIGLKPGYTAEVSIEVTTLPKVLTVPIQAVAEAKGKHYAYVLGPAGVARREVTVGENNEKFVEIRAGLEEGEAVCLDARARATAEMQAGEKDVQGDEPRKTPAVASPRSPT
jgi:RND family efflux transporter MFP subunit